MAFIAVSGGQGCRQEELALILAQRAEGELIAEPDLEKWIAAQFPESPIPDRAWRALASSFLASLALETRHAVVCCLGAEVLVSELPGCFRVHVVAPESARLAHLTASLGISRTDARRRLQKMTSAEALSRKRRFGLKSASPTGFDLILNSQALEPGAMAGVVMAALGARGLLDAEPLSPVDKAGIQFRIRLQLARFGIVPPDRVHLERKAFGHPSEQVFANLLDFYRIAWDYEPRSFPLQWDKDGKVSEAFTPDFYLPEFDLYVELTTMKQANVTRKNRKIRLLRAIYPHVNIQVFYQKDVQDLVMKYRPHQNA